MVELTPLQIVSELDKHIIGQDDAKRAVAIALRNKWRRLQVDEVLRNEIMPKNILMIGPTGVGKTEIARRLAKLANAPFIKVEATKFTEVGYVGRDVESIVRDLVDMAVKMTRIQEMEKVRARAEQAAENRVLDILLPTARTLGDQENPINTTRDKFREKLKSGQLADKEIEVEVTNHAIGVEIMTPPGMEEMTNQLQRMIQNASGGKKRVRKIRVSEALKVLAEEEAAKLVNEEDIKIRAIENVEQNGIVFIDEIDKVTRRGHASGPDVSREGVQRDLLPLIEGCTVSTRHGTVRTDHILFITSGAFHMSKPSDLIPELQGRLPIRVELNALGVNEFIRILTEPDASLTEQYIALLKTEDFDLSFSKDGLSRIAEIAWQVNESAENIGARRLHTVMERLLDTLSFEAPTRRSEKVIVDAKYVDEQLSELIKNEDLTKYIL